MIRALFNFIRARLRLRLPRTADTLDRQLVRASALRRIPTVRQLAHLRMFLGRGELWLVRAASLVVVGGLLWYARGYVEHHRIRVPASGGEYREALLGEARRINPVLAPPHTAEADLVRLVFSGLLRYDSEGALAPDAAVRVSASPDSRIFTAELRTDVRFHDDERMDAEDVAFTIKMIQRAENNSPLAKAFHNVKVETPDTHTVRFTLPEPFAPFPHLLTVGILPAHRYSTVPPETFLARASLPPTGSGPFKFYEWHKTGEIIHEITLARHEAWHRTAPHLARIIFKFFNGAEALEDALLRKETHGANFVLPEAASRIESGGWKVYTVELPEYTALFLNEERAEFLRDKRVREALDYALDRSHIVAQAMGGGRIAAGPIPAASLDTAESPPVQYDPASSAQLLEAAGYTMVERKEAARLLGEEQMRQWREERASGRAEGGVQAEINPFEEAAQREVVAKEIETELPPSPAAFRAKGERVLVFPITTTAYSHNVATARAVSNFWQSIGIHAPVVVLPETAVTRTIAQKNYAVLLTGVLVGSDPDPFPLWHNTTDPQSPALAVFVNRAIDEVLEKARAEVDNAKRVALYRQFQELLAKGKHALFLYHPTYSFAVPRHLDGIRIGRMYTPADRFTHIEAWHVRKKWQWRW